jgi:hypothetical protein
MAVFDPNDWWAGGSWFKPADQDRRRPEEINREVVSRWPQWRSACALRRSHLWSTSKVPLRSCWLGRA